MRWTSPGCIAYNPRRARGGAADIPAWMPIGPLAAHNVDVARTTGQAFEEAGRQVAEGPPKALQKTFLAQVVESGNGNLGRFEPLA